MKKLLFLLAALPLLFLTACHDDDDLPNVNVGITYSGATSVDGTLYAVQGDTLAIDSVYVTPVEPNSRAAIGSVTYVLDQRIVSYTPFEPFAISIQTGVLPVGKHLLRLDMSVLQVDKSLGAYYLGIPFVIVESKDDIPSGAQGTPGSYKDQAIPSDK